MTERVVAGAAQVGRVLAHRSRRNHDCCPVHGLEHLLTTAVTLVPAFLLDWWLSDPLREGSEISVKAFTVSVGVLPLAIVLADAELRLVEISLY